MNCKHQLLGRMIKTNLAQIQSSWRDRAYRGLSLILHLPNYAQTQESVSFILLLLQK